MPHKKKEPDPYGYDRANERIGKAMDMIKRSKKKSKDKAEEMEKPASKRNK